MAFSLALAAGIAVIIIAIWYLATRKTTTSPNPPPASKQYTLYADLSNGGLKPGDNSAMEFFVDNDPTHGAVSYGKWDDLVTILPNGTTVIEAGPANATGPHRMVRLTSNKVYNSGLFVMSAFHIPEGMGTWPSFWLTSLTGTWACNGEIDIIEGVNSADLNSSRNASTLHTNDKPGAPPCRSPTVPGISNGGDCTAGGPGKCGCNSSSICPFNGCGVSLPSTISFGRGFNLAGGGTYACELTPAGAVTIWFFPRGREPDDLLADKPNPQNWPTNYRTAFTACPGQFADLAIIINTTLCGDWAGNVYPGGMDKCVADVNSKDLPDAYWSIEYVKVYLQNSEMGRAAKPAPTPNGPPLR